MRPDGTLAAVDADNKDNPQLNAVMGVALRALVDAGAEPGFLATFVDRYRNEFAQQLQLPVAAPAPDLRAVIVAAVAEALGATGPRPRRGKQTQPVNVLVNGQRTTVTVRKDRFQTIEQLVGGGRQARQVIQQLAATAPADADRRSTWLDTQLDAFIQLRQSAPASPQRH